MPTKISTFMVIKEDLSHIGGAMGTEYTETIETKYFTTKAGAMEWIKKDLRKSCGKSSKLPEPTISDKERTYWDCMSIGYDLRKHSIIIHD